jgi:hypothetical protein
MTLGDEPVPLTGEGAGASSSFPSPSSSEESFVPGNMGQLPPETPHMTCRCVSLLRRDFNTKKVKMLLGQVTHGSAQIKKNPRYTLSIITSHQFLCPGISSLRDFLPNHKTGRDGDIQTHK